MIVTLYDKLLNRNVTVEDVLTFFDSGRSYTIYFEDSVKDPDVYAKYPKHRFDLCFVGRS